MTLFKTADTENHIYLIYDINRARCRYSLEIVNTETELQAAIQAAEVHHAEPRRGKTCAPFAYEVFRTKEDFEIFKAQLAADRVKYEVQEYREHVKEECANLAREIKVLELTKDVCGQFDGKVLNARFYKKLGEVCDCVVYENYSRLNFAKCDEIDFDIYISQNAKCPTDWRWPSGSRLDGGAAAEVLKNCIQCRLDKTEELRASVRHYAAYLRKARKIEGQLEELGDAPFCVRNFAKENHLTGACMAKYIWR